MINRKPFNRRRPTGRKLRKPSGKKVIRRKKVYKKRSPSKQLIQANLGGLSMTSYASARRPSPIIRTMKKAGSPNYTNLQYSWAFGSSAGQQSVSEAFLNNREDLARIWASIQGQIMATNPTSKLQVPVDSTGNPANATFRVALESAQHTLHFANTGSTPVNVTLYDVVCSKHVPLIYHDLSGSPVSSAGQPLTMTPVVSWAEGYNNQYLAGSAYKPLQVIGSTIANLGVIPTESEFFRRYYKVVKKTTLSLPIGGQHKHLVGLKSNYIVNNNLFSQNGQFAGLSYTTLMVVSGVPVVACPLSASLPPQATTSQTSVSCVQTVKYKWTWVRDSETNVYNANYLPSGAIEAQSIQPSFTKVYDADSSFARISLGGSPQTFQYTDLPSECTR